MVHLIAVSSESILSYTFLDRGSGRCRMNQNTLKVCCPTAKIGSIIKVKLFIDEDKSSFVIVLSTIWPDNLEIIEENCICLDVAVVLSDKQTLSSWQESSCEIIEVVNPKPCSSLRYRLLNPLNIRSLIPSLLSGLAVQSNSRLDSKVNSSSFSLQITRTNPEGPVICSNATLLIEEKEDDTAASSTFGVISSSAISTVVASSTKTSVSLKEAYCCTSVVQEIMQHIIQPFVSKTPEIFRYKGIMLLGPPGVGKSYALTALQKHCQSYCQVEVVKLSIPDLLAEEDPVKYLEKMLPKPLQSILSSSSSSTLKAKTPEKSPLKTVKPLSLTTASQLPCAHFILIDEIDALGASHNQNEIQISIKSRICEWLDTPMLPPDALQYQHTYCMIATSNRSEDIDSIFRRGGRLEYELYVLNRPEDRRLLLISYLEYFLDALTVSPSTTIPPLYIQYLSKRLLARIATEIAEKTGGYVAADIANLIRELSDGLQSFLFTPITDDHLLDMKKEDIEEHLKQQIFTLFATTMQTILPSCLRGISIAVPQLTFQDIIGYEEIKTIIIRSFSFLQPAKKELLAKFHMTSSLGGILLHGPPGNSKTRFVKAIASMYGLPLITLTSADVYSAYVGDAEAEIRKAFTIARQASPCILFFDELDSLVINRATAGLSSNASSVEARVLATFLNEMDGVTANANATNGVIVMGATNRIDCIDAALIRKGRFYQSIFVPPPTATERMLIVRYFLSKMLPYALQFVAVLQPDVAPIEDEEMRLYNELVGQLWEGMSGAQIEALCRERILSYIDIKQE